MAEKIERLRAGESVEFRPGVDARLNFEDETIELSTGEKIKAKNNPHLFPKSDQELNFIKQKEKLKREISSIPGGEFLFQASQTSAARGIEDWAERLTMSADDYLNRRQAKQQVGREIAKKSPLSSGAGQVVGAASDLLLPFKSGAAFGAATPVIAAGSEVLEHPFDVAAQSAIGAAGGLLIDKGVGALNKIAARRQLSRQVPQQAAAVREANRLAQEAEQSSFNRLSEATRRENEALQHQYQLKLNERQNRLFEAQQAKEAAKNANASLNEQYRVALKEYQEALKEAPRLQKEAQQRFSQGVLKNVERIEKAFPKQSKITTAEMGIGDFIENSLQKEGLLATPEGARTAKILKGLFPEGETLTASQLAKRYKALEESIQRTAPESSQLLVKFKDYLGERLPVMVENSLLFSRVAPRLERELGKDLQKAITSLNLPKQGIGSESFITKRVNENLKNVFSELTPAEFASQLKEGSLGQYLRERLISPEDFRFSIPTKKAVSKAKKGGTVLTEEKIKDLGLSVVDPATQKHAQVLEKIGNKIDEQIARAQRELIPSAVDAQKRLGGAVRKTLGQAETLPSPSIPVQPTPVSVAPTAPIPEIPVPPSPLPMPTRQSVPLQPEPSLPAAQSVTEKIGDVLEKPILQGKTGLGKLGPIGQLAGLKYLFGSKALPVEASYLALKGLTAPGAESLRAGLRAGSVEAVVQLAEKYPSYHDGIIGSPQERRSFTKELEDQDMPLEAKAIFQSKANRGIPLWKELD